MFYIHFFIESSRLPVEVAAQDPDEEAEVYHTSGRISPVLPKATLFVPQQVGIRKEMEAN